MRREDKERVLVEVTARVLDDRIRQAKAGRVPLDGVLSDALYHERKRMERDLGSSARRADQIFWREVGQSLMYASEEQLRDLLRRVVQRYVLEIMGDFNETFYKLTTAVVPMGLMGVLNGVSPQRLLRGREGFPKVEDSIVLRGHTEAFQRVAQRGTVILAPTHSSHLDSVVIGWALYHLGLPPFLYGAGLNLFQNRVVGFFMSNLGAYRVDRKKQHALYKDILKEYATYSLEIGYHNLFFPGGTRARSGAVEQRLKLGLLGTGLRAYIHRLAAGVPSPNVYVVPCTVNYPLVLEAETLIDDHLAEQGKAQYIITDDEFSRPRRVWQFLKELIQLDSRITIEFAPPLDVFGNAIDEEGRSVDARGRVIDISRYVLVGDTFAPDDDRDRQYTRELGDALARAYRTHAVCASTHVAARAVFGMARARNPGLDLYRLLRTGGEDEGFSLADVVRTIDGELDAVRGLAAEGELRLTGALERSDAREVLTEALRLFGTYHDAPALVRRGDRVFSEDMNLLYYYHNRLDGYRIGPRPRSGSDDASRRAA